jgi:DNA (cytosine-5)-methyltransferase 1
LTLGAIEGARRLNRGARLALAVDNDAEPLDVMRETLALEPERFRVADLETRLGHVGARETKAERALFADIATPHLLLAGPPCQGHSALNNHTRHDDPRNDLYVRVARAAQLLEPAVVIVENVRGVASDRRGAVDTCSAQLQALGYSVTSRRLNLFELGAPQRRVRHVLVAARAGDFRWLLPVPHRRTVRWAIEDLLAREGTSALDTPSKVTPANASRIAWLFENDAYDLPNELRPVCHQSDHTYRSMYGRLRWDTPAQTITSGFGSMGQGRYVHPSRRRTLTPHEAARLQFLPDFVTLEMVAKRGALATMIGNAAPPALTISLVQALLEQKLL